MTKRVVLLGLVAAVLIAVTFARRGEDTRPQVLDISLDGSAATIVLPSDSGLTITPGGEYSTVNADEIATAATGSEALFLWVQTSEFATGKKQLRLDIESRTSGEARLNLLRRLVPVFTDLCVAESAPMQGVDHSASRLDRQLQDDALYVGFNFAGLGFRAAAACDAERRAALLDVIGRSIVPEHTRAD